MKPSPTLRRDPLNPKDRFSFFPLSSVLYPCTEDLIFLNPNEKTEAKQPLLEKCKLSHLGNDPETEIVSVKKDPTKTQNLTVSVQPSLLNILPFSGVNQPVKLRLNLIAWLMFLLKSSKIGGSY